MLGDHEQEPSVWHDRVPVGGRESAVIQERPRTYPNYEGYAEEAPSEQEIDLLHYWRVVTKYWLLIAAALVLAIGIGVVVILLSPRIYTAETTVQIDKQTAQVVQLEGAEPREVIASEEFFQTQYGLLKSTALAERTIDNLNLTRDGVYLKAIDVAPSGASQAQLRKAIVGNFKANLNVEPVRGSRLVKITFDSPNPQISAKIANGIAENFISWNLARRYEASAYGRTFLQEQLAKEKVKLEEAERKLAAYATRQRIVTIPGSGDSESSSGSANQSLVASSLMAQNTALAQARGERIKAEARWRQARATPASDLPEVLQSSTIQELKATRSKLESDYQDMLKKFKPDYPDMIALQARLNSAERALNIEIRNVQNSLKTQYDVALAQENQFQQQVNQLTSSVLDLRDRSIEYVILEREADTSRQLYEGLLQNFRELGVAGGLANNNISIIDRAEPPAGPSKPRPVRILFLSAAAGLILGLLLAFGMEFLDESIRVPEDIEKKLGLPMLGTIPRLDKGETPSIALGDVRSSFAEAYYSVRTALQFSTSRGAPSTLLITSARPSEGKSTSATAIATNFARLGSKVLLIDGDLRNPSLHRVLAADNSRGLSNYLTGNAPLEQVVQPTATLNLSFMPCGPLPPSPAELLAGNRMQLLLEEARQHFDIVIIDGPPVMGLADAPLLASMVEGAMLVVEAGGTGRRLARVAIRRLSVGNARLLGVLLTKFDARKANYGSGYGYGYAYDYGTRPSLPSG
jgi:polysaccharide biosynthesis transport protein